MIRGLKIIHNARIIHKDYHSGNIFIYNSVITATGDFGLSKSAMNDDDNDIYGIIPYVPPEVLQGKKYTEASDIYSFGMIMWELMTGRRPFWDKNHDTDLIIEICDGLRPLIVTSAPEGYIELMKQCWHSDPNERPTATGLEERFSNIYYKEQSCFNKKNPTEIIKSPDIGPITTNNPGAIYKSRPLSVMIKSAESTRNLKIQNKRKFEDNSSGNNFKDGNNVKKIKLNKNNDYWTKELGFDIDDNIKSSKPNNNNYISKEIGFD
ncbi:kinase-like domain-containing protein, partial [Glomus cerebriforme]